MKPRFTEPAAPSEPVEITVLGKPVSWKRAQRNPLTGAVYVDRQSETYRAIIREAARAPMAGRPLLEGPLEMSVLAVFSIPTTWAKYRIAAAHRGAVPKTGGIDLDNIIKALKDSLESVVYRNDDQVCAYGACSKIYGDKPRLEVRIAPIAVKIAAPLGRPLEAQHDLFVEAAQ
jgi:Holliday junction resolvase RusA-like endonuclease